jgi:hypothetical protein
VRLVFVVIAAIGRQAIIPDVKVLHPPPTTEVLHLLPTIKVVCPLPALRCCAPSCRDLTPRCSARRPRPRCSTPSQHQGAPFTVRVDVLYAKPPPDVEVPARSAPRCLRVVGDDNLEQPRHILFMEGKSHSASPKCISLLESARGGNEAAATFCGAADLVWQKSNMMQKFLELTSLL